jgi:hypothetical protein
MPRWLRDIAPRLFCGCSGLEYHARTEEYGWPKTGDQSFSPLTERR